MTTLLIASSMYAQRPIPENTMVSETALFKREYPRVDKQKRGYFRLYAPWEHRGGSNLASMLPRRRRYTWYAENDMT